MAGPSRFVYRLAVVALVVCAECRAQVELTGPNVCLTLVNDEGNTLIPVYENEPVIVPTFCLKNWSFICYVKTLKTLPKLKKPAKGKTKILRKCCEGYENSVDDSHCRPVCSFPCIWGECVAPDVCKCNSYYDGRSCNISKVMRQECPVGHYGFDCSQTCSCQNDGICDQIEGNCHCRSGYTGVNCESTCPPGLFGYKCKHKCKCQTNESCNPFNGMCNFLLAKMSDECDLDCLSQFNSIDCLRRCREKRENSSLCDPVNGGCDGKLENSINRNCLMGFFGPDCQYECDCKNGGYCDSKSDGICSCPEGFVGKHCEEMCPQGYYGHECKNKCRCQNEGLCDVVNGNCFCRAGYLGKFCSFPCPVGTYGHHCKFKCNCHNGTLCNVVNGLCECPIGYTGKYCNVKEVEMNATAYLDIRMENCNCNWFKAYSCDLLTGKCKCKHDVDGDCHCRRGRTGYDCNTLCPQGTYGLNCKYSCKCKNNAKCRPFDGVCLCKPGFYGPYCGKVCPHNYYGRMCLSKCRCNKLTEICHPVRGCIANDDRLNNGDVAFFRFNDNDERTIWFFNISFLVNILVASIVVVAVLSAVLTGCYFYYHRYLEQKMNSTRANILERRDSYFARQNTGVIGAGRDDARVAPWDVSPRMSFANEVFFTDFSRGQNLEYNSSNENTYIEISESGSRCGDEMYDRLDFLRPTGSWKPHYQCTLSLHDQSGGNSNSNGNDSSKSGKTK